MASPIPHRKSTASALVPALLAFALVATPGRTQDADPPAPDGKPAPEAAGSPEGEKKLTPKEFEELLGKLSDDDFATRELAEQRLSQGVTSELAEVARLRFLATPDPEVHFRLRRILREIVEADYYGRKKAFLGIQMQDSMVIGGKTGRETILSVQVLSLISPSAAEAQGIKEGDQILKVDGKGFEISPSMEFKAMIGGRAAGDKVKFTLRSGGVVSEKTVALGEMPPDIARLNAESPLAFDSFFQAWLLRGGSTSRP